MDMGRYLYRYVSICIPKESHRTPITVDENSCYWLSSSLLKFQGSSLGSLHQLQRTSVLRVHMEREKLSKIFYSQGLNGFQPCRPVRFCSGGSFCLKAYMVCVVLGKLAGYMWNLEYTIMCSMPDFTTQFF